MTFHLARGRPLLILFTVLVAALCAPLAATAQQRTIVIGADENINGWGAKMAALVYTEAFKRMGIPVRLVNYPLARHTALQDSGDIDGDAGRVHQYGDAHPNLIRVEESFAEMHFGLFTAKPDLKLKSLDDLRHGDWTVDYRRGLLMCEKTLRQVVPPDRLNDLTSETQGAKKLLAGRSDLYCDLDIPFNLVLAAPDLKADASRIRKVFDLGGMKVYPYLHKKNAALAPQLAAVLKQMKAEGLIEAYHAQLATEFGIRR